MTKGNKDNVHLKLSEELEGIDAELDLAMEALSATNDRIDTYLNGGGELPEHDDSAAELPEVDDDATELPDDERAEETAEA